MFYAFDLDKTVQAASVVVKRHDGRIGRMRLLKLLYLADRALLAERGRPITGDRVVAMRKGPVLSQTYELIKGQHVDAPAWDRVFDRFGNIDVILAAEPQPGRLSQREVETLQDLCDRHMPLDDDDLSDLTHELPEWRDVYTDAQATTPISGERILEAVGRSADEATLRERAELEAREDEAFAAFGIK